MEYDSLTSVFADMTFNLEEIHPEDEVRLNFAFMHHEVEQDNDEYDRILVRDQTKMNGWSCLIYLIIMLMLGNISISIKVFKLVTNLLNSINLYHQVSN